MTNRLSDSYRRPRKVAMSCAYCGIGLLLAMALPLAAEANREKGGWMRRDGKRVLTLSGDTPVASASGAPTPASVTPGTYDAARLDEVMQDLRSRLRDARERHDRAIARSRIGDTFSYTDPTDPAELSRKRSEAEQCCRLVRQLHDHLISATHTAQAAAAGLADRSVRQQIERSVATSMDGLREVLEHQLRLEEEAFAAALDSVALVEASRGRVAVSRSGTLLFTRESDLFLYRFHRARIGRLMNARSDAARDLADTARWEALTNPLASIPAAEPVATQVQTPLEVTSSGRLRAGEVSFSLPARRQELERAWGTPRVVSDSPQTEWLVWDVQGLVARAEPSGGQVTSITLVWDLNHAASLATAGLPASALPAHPRNRPLTAWGGDVTGFDTPESLRRKSGAILLEESPDRRSARTSIGGLTLTLPRHQEGLCPVLTLAL